MRYFIVLGLIIASVSAVTTEEIVRKFKLIIPPIPVGEISTAPCSETMDSMSYHYNPKTGKLDSMTGAMKGIRPDATRRKEIHQYTDLPSGEYIEVVIHYNAENGEVIFKDTHRYRKDGRRVSTHSTSQMTVEKECVTKYDSRGNKAKYICMAKGGKILSHYNYTYDQKNRLVREWYDELNPNQYFSQEFTGFDSVAARFGNHPVKVKFPHFVSFYDKRKLKVKEISYGWNTDSLPSQMWLYDYNENRLPIRILSLVDTTLSLKPDPKKFAVYGCTFYEYDEKNRVTKEVLRGTPLKD